MPEKNDGGFAFPNVTRISCPGGEVSKITGGMTLRDYACIALKVPDTDKDWLNKIIEKSLTNDRETI